VQAYHFSMLGLAFDIAGAFLVAVEAIKLENLRTLRDRILSRLEDYTRSPRLTIVDENDQPTGPTQPAVPADRHPGLFMGLHYVAGLALVLILNQLIEGRIYRLFVNGILWTLERRWYVAVVITIAFVFIGVVAGLWLLGELVHITLTKAVQIPIKLVDFIDARTPDGTVGVIGFLLLVTGFVLQMCGAYLSG
jgi:hypothetical protein